MIFVVFVVVLAFVVVSFHEGGHSRSVGWEVTGILVSILLTGVLIAMIALIVDVSDGKVIPEKIAMYETENQKIEESIDLVIQKYLGYETETYEKMRGEGGSVAIVTAYPELASSTLVAKQIETYINNNDMIKALKVQQISLSVKKWWLYFGS